MNQKEQTRLLRLISRLNEHRLDTEELEELTARLKTDEQARLLYCRMQQQEADLLQANQVALKEYVATNRSRAQLAGMPKFANRWLPHVAKIAAVLVIAAAIAGAVGPIKRTYQLKNAPAVAVLRSVDSAGSKPLHPGRVSLGEGHFLIDFYSGAQIQLQGPAKFSIKDAKTIEVEDARIAANVSRDAKGFRMDMKGTSLVDLGTEFAVDIQPGRSSLEVFKGEVLANTTNEEGSTERSLLVTPENPLQFDSTHNRYRSLEAPNTAFLKFKSHSTPPLSGLNDYKTRVFQDQPAHFWSFDESTPEGFIDAQRHRLLQAKGNHIELEKNGQNGAVTFTDDEDFHMLQLQGDLEFQKNQPFSIEFLFCPDRIRWGTLLSLYQQESVRPDGGADHFILIETVAQNDFFTHIPGAIRATYRPVPSGNSVDGINSFSNHQYQPGKWIHFVMTFDGNTLRTYSNGVRQNTLNLDPDENPQTGRYAMVLGQIASFDNETPPETNYRPFAGSIDELALYFRALNEDEILDHFRESRL